jgi:inositol-pentakisphosphate 2-kinase
LFSEDQLIDQSIVDLRPAKVIEKLNKELRGWEIYDYPTKGSLVSSDVRPTKRQGIYLAEDDYGLLVTDMTPHGSGETVIELKPKWLLQSPSAPKDSKRCRQCARIARENAERARKGEKFLSYFCPLDLLSKDPHVTLAVSRLLFAPSVPPAAILHRMSYWLQTNTLLQRLYNYQQIFDRVGPLNGDCNDKDFLCAMTLRDCSVYLRFPSDGDTRPIEARIGDLDLKSKDKKQYWHDLEKQLIDEGWYQGTEEHQQPNKCQLSPDRNC